MDDKLILSLLDSSPETGLWELTRKYAALCGAVIGRILPGRAEDIEECVSDTFVRVWKNHKSITLQNNSIKGYIICAARSIAIDRYRKLKKEAAVMPLQDFMPDDNILHEAAEHKDNLQTIKSVICEMPQPDREIFLRRYFLYQPIKEIAEFLNMGDKAVESRLFRARKKLKTALEERGVPV